MITYEVKYKRTNSFFWKKLKKVKGDGYVEGGFNHATGELINSKDIRWFQLEDETRIEVPANTYLFEFSKERHFSIKDRMEAEASSSVKTDPR